MNSSKANIVLDIFAGLGGYFIFLKDTIRWMFRPPFDGKNLTAQMLEYSEARH